MLETDVGVNAGFILSTRSRPDGGWWGSGSRGFLEQLGLTSQGGLETFTYMEQKGPAPCPAQGAFIRLLATQAGAPALCSARPASRTRLTDSFFWTELREPEAGQCCPQNTVVSCHPKCVLQGPCSGCQDGLVTKMEDANHPGCLGPRRFLGCGTFSADTGMIGYPTRRSGRGDCPHLQSHQIQIRHLCGFFPFLFIVITIHVM